MKRIVVAGLAGAVVYYVWQMLAWMMLPIHAPTLKGLPDEPALRKALTAQKLETGWYSMPYGTDAEMMDPDSDFATAHKSGPLVQIFYHKDGSEVMPPMMMVIGFATDFAAAFLVAWLLSCAVGGCCSSYVRRVGFVSGFGVFLALTGHVAYFNWMRFPAHYSAMCIVDALVGWFLVGLAIAAIVKPPEKPAAS